MKRMIICVIMGVVSINFLNAQGRFSGQMFGDYYYVAANHDSTYKGENGFWFRRIYFTDDYGINENFFTRFRIEANSPDFTKNSQKLVPFIKDAYLKWKIKKVDLILGISPTPTWDLIEDFWKYRSVEKTPLDLQKFGSSRDFGFSIKGKTGKEENLGYHFMFANGEGENSENNRFKKLMGAIDFGVEHFVFQIYGDFEEGKKHTDKYTYQGFLGIELGKFRIGAQFASQIREFEPDSQKVYEILSSFFVFNLNEKISFLLRYDKMFDPSPSGISYIPFAQAKSNLLIAGIDLRPNEVISFIPNVEYIFYDKENDYKPGSDLYLRLTFYYNFK